jgi:hypothetical protein
MDRPGQPASQPAARVEPAPGGPGRLSDLRAGTRGIRRRAGDLDAARHPGDRREGAGLFHRVPGELPGAGRGEGARRAEDRVRAGGGGADPLVAGSRRAERRGGSDRDAARACCRAVCACCQIARARCAAAGARGEEGARRDRGAERRAAGLAGAAARGSFRRERRRKGGGSAEAGRGEDPEPRDRRNSRAVGRRPRRARRGEGRPLREPLGEGACPRDSPVARGRAARAAARRRRCLSPRLLRWPLRLCRRERLSPRRLPARERWIERRPSPTVSKRSLAGTGPKSPPSLS